MRQGITIDKKIMRQGIMWKDTFKISRETMDFGKIFMRQGILLGNFLCDRVTGGFSAKFRAGVCRPQFQNGTVG